MSAYLVEPPTIGELAARLVRAGIAPYTPTKVAKALAIANLEGVGYRYEMTFDEVAAGLAFPRWGKYAQICCRMAWKYDKMQVGSEAPRVAATILLQLCNEFEYQACEAPDYEQSTIREWIAKAERVCQDAEREEEESR